MPWLLTQPRVVRFPYSPDLAADIFRRFFADPAFVERDSDRPRVGLAIRFQRLGGDLRPVVGAGGGEALAIGGVANEELAQRRPLAVGRGDEALVAHKAHRLR